MQCSTLLSRALPAWIFFFSFLLLSPPPSPLACPHICFAARWGRPDRKWRFSAACDGGRESRAHKSPSPLALHAIPALLHHQPSLSLLLPSPPSLPPLLQWGNQGCEALGPRKCSHISKGSWAPCGSSPEKEKVKMNTVGEDEGTRAELINISSGCERTPAQADPGLLPASFSSLKEKNLLSTVHF